jgi:hypothetical protein
MWRWCASPPGALLIAVALVARPSAVTLAPYAGGSAVHGSAGDGRYVVNPGHGRPVAEVPGSTWRAVYWAERLWPWSAVVPCWAGEVLPGVLGACSAGAGFVVAGAWLCSALVRTPRVVVLVPCVLFYVSVGAVVWLHTRSSYRQPTAEPRSAPDAGR